MKTINLLTILILLVSSSCGPSKEQKNELANRSNLIEVNAYHSYLSILDIKDHEYLNLGESLIHSQSCKCLNKQIIDLPEEYTLISHNHNKPDTIISWISNDTLFIRFKH